MTTSQQLAKHLHDIHFGGNWTASNIKDSLAKVDWRLATKKVKEGNSILALTYHIYYFVKVAIPVFDGGKLDAHDKFSFDHPEINSEEEWQNFILVVLEAGKRLSELIADFPDDKLCAPFTDEKYGSYFRNILGTIEHSHYHLGQINVMRKVV